MHLSKYTYNRNLNIYTTDIICGSWWMIWISITKRSWFHK